MFDRADGSEVQAGSVGFRNVENPRLRAPPPRLRQRLVKHAEDEALSGSALGSSGSGDNRLVKECETLPGTAKTVPLARLLAVDTGDVDPAGLGAPAVMTGPIPKEKAQPLAPQAEPAYVPSITIDPNLLWSSRGKPLPPRSSNR
mmetsp:Transcript_4098/g.7484  ORF Transcript_4098/g.7484 Transcript_4098/m.7484 type:complete len:145 (+) Transcript_4098:36-470(+)